MKQTTPKGIEVHVRLGGKSNPSGIVQEDETVNHIISKCNKQSQNECKRLQIIVLRKLNKILKFGHADKCYLHKHKCIS